jgi:phosphoglucosamine mutase
MPRLFGTDGIRGVANSDLTPHLVLTLGRAAGQVLAPNGRVVVGRDTRVSGPMLEGALVAGLCSAGVEVGLAGIIPTPGVAFLTADDRASAGAVISASHNPVPDNGIKFFSPLGTKIEADLEAEIEATMEREPQVVSGTDIGGSASIPDALDRYAKHLLDALGTSLSGLKVVLDCAYGAAFEIAPRVFEEAGAEVIALNDLPDGTRINVDCGSTSLSGLARVVLGQGAHMGIAFDGDADRALAVDEKGAEVDGDRIVGMWALQLHQTGSLPNDTVVATVMTNLGLRRELERRGIEVLTAPVGDRFVAEMMSQQAVALGGEQSGHVIFAEHSPTGDGVLTALKVAELAASSGAPLSDLAHFYEPYPQVLINVAVGKRGELEGAEEIWAQVRAAEEELGADGRVLVRESGTELLVRVMVEAEDARLAERIGKTIASQVEARLG